MGQGPRQEDLAAAGWPDEENGVLRTPARDSSSVERCQDQDAFRSVLARDELIELSADGFRGRHGRGTSCGATATAFLLVDDRLAKLDAPAADVDLTRPFNQGADVPVVFATKRAVGVAF